MRRRFVCAPLIVLAAVITAQHPIAQAGEKHVFVTVLDKEGAPIEGLAAEHFAIRESGKDRTVVRVEPLKVPMHVAVLVDISSGHDTPAFRTAVSSFVERLAAFNQVALFAFGDQVTQVAGFTQNVSQLKAGVVALFGRMHSRSALIDALDLALNSLDAIETARPVIVAITSEAAEASSRSAGSTIKKLIAQSVAFHAVSLSGVTVGSATRVSNDIPSSSARLNALVAAGQGDRERNQMVEQGTSLTGGSRQRLTNTLALDEALSRVRSELANGYRVTFARSGSDKIKDLQVGIMLEGVTLRATAAPFGTR